MFVRTTFSIAAFAVAAIVVTPVGAQNTTLVSVDSVGAQGDNFSGYLGVSISGTGQFVAFVSLASNLVLVDTNGLVDVFVRDRQTGTTERVSVDSVGVEGNGDSGFTDQSVSISADGRFVTFQSDASNLVASDTNTISDIFVRDRQTGTTERVSVSTGGVEGSSGSYVPSLSADGRFVAFLSVASNLVAGDTNGFVDVFVRDRQSGTTERVSVDSAGVAGNGTSDYSSISADGRFVAFRSFAMNLAAGDTNWYPDIFVHDRQTGATERVSVGSGGTQGIVSSEYPSISADGRFVAFHSESWNLVAGDTNGSKDIFVRDRLNGTTERVSLNSTATQGNSNSENPSISNNGRFVAFQSTANNLVASDTNLVSDVFVHDRQTGLTERASVASGGPQGDTDSYIPSISGNGAFVAFVSIASNLVTGDTNGFEDVFVRDRTSPGSVVYCTSGTTSHGCSASLAASANPSVSLAHVCTITITDVEGLKTGLVFYGVNNAGFTPGAWAPGSTSLLCVKAPTQRTPIQNSGGTFNACDGSFVLDWNTYQAANPLALGNPWGFGDKVFAQAWFRDPLAVKSTNLSNAIEMTYVP